MESSHIYSLLKYWLESKYQDTDPIHYGEERGFEDFFVFLPLMSILPLLYSVLCSSLDFQKFWWNRLTNIILWLRSVYVALCAKSRVAQSLVSGPLLLCRMFAPSPQRSQWLCQNLNHLHRWVSCSKTGFFREEAMQWFTFWWHPVVHSRCFVYLKDAYSFFKASHLHHFPWEASSNTWTSSLTLVVLFISDHHQNAGSLCKVLKAHRRGFTMAVELHTSQIYWVKLESWWSPSFSIVWSWRQHV